MVCFRVFAKLIIGLKFKITMMTVITMIAVAEVVEVAETKFLISDFKT